MKLAVPTSAKILADQLGGVLLGNADLVVSGINEIHKVEPGDVTFVDVAKYYNKALQSAADVILIDQRVDCPPAKALIVVESPFDCYNELVSRFKPPAQVPAGHFTRGENVVIGEGTIIYPGVFIADNVRIGTDCVIHPNAVIYDQTIIGNGVIIGANAVIGSDAFYFKGYPDRFSKMISCGRVIIEDFADIGACASIARGVSGDTIIGRHTKIDNLVHVGHGTTIGQRCILAGQVGVGGKVTIEDDVRLWGQVGVKKGVRIGRGSVLGAQSGVGRSLKGGTSYFGTPAVEMEKSLEQYSAMRKLPRLVEKFKSQQAKEPTGE